MDRIAGAALLALGVAACAGGRPPLELAGRTLGYATAPATLVYDFADSTAFVIRAGAMGDMRVRSDQSGTAELAFQEDTAGLVGRLHVTAFDGRFENPGQGGLAADESDIRGGWTVRVDPRGRVEVVDTPWLSPAGREIIGPESFVRPFFAHLPASAPDLGVTWGDTVSITERAGGTVSRARTVVRSMVTGDTIVNDRFLAVIRTEGDTTVDVEGVSGGVEVVQRLAGVIHGIILWDPVAGVMVERSETGTLEGTLELPGMGFGGLPVEGTVRRRVLLRPDVP